MDTSDDHRQQHETVDLTVSGMHCGSCVTLIEETLSDTAGVSSVRVDLDSASAAVRFDPAAVNPEFLCATVAELGYRAAVR